MFVPNPFKSKAWNVKRGLRERPPGIQLANTFGGPTCAAVIDIVVDHHCAAAVAANQSYDMIFAGGDQYIQLDQANGQSAGLRIQNLCQMMKAGGLSANLAANTLAQATYGVAPGDNDIRKAAKWICHASNTLGGANQAGVENVLNWINLHHIRLDSEQNLRLANANINAIGGGVAPAYRGVALPPSRIPSSAMGAWLLAEVATRIGNYPAMIGAANGPHSWTDLALYLLAAIIRAHGFTDGNGRTARVAYAACLLRGGVAFDAPTNAHEQTLHQL